MPSAIGQRIAAALSNGRVSAAEVKQLIEAAKAEKKFTAEMKGELQALLDQHADAFLPSVRATLQRFVDQAAVQRDLADPTVLDKHSTSVSWTPVNANQTLYVDGVDFDDVVQGSIANCYMVSAFSSLAYANPDLIKNAFTDNGDGTFDVRFFEADAYGRYTPVTVTIDSDVPASSGTTGRYGKARDGNELWVTLLEKAYAQWKGGYEAIGNGGRSGDVFEALTGRRSGWSSTSYTPADTLYTSISRAVAAHRPVTAGTHGEDSGVNYSGTGVYAWHAYSVLDTRDEGGVKSVQLRNPWGNTEPGNDGKNDGIFWMTMEDFTKLYSGVYLGG